MSTPTAPVDAKRLTLQAPTIVTIVLSTAGAVWVLGGYAQDVGNRITRVEFAMEAFSKEIGALTRAVDVGVSTVQAESWITLFRANLRVVDPKLSDTVPDLPKRER